MMPVTDPATPIRRAVDELAALALAVRADWQEHWIRGAISQGAAEGMTWPQVLVSLSRLMADPAASPRDLVPDSRTPLKRHLGATDPEGGAAAVRAEMDAARLLKQETEAAIAREMGEAQTGDAA